MEKCIVCGKEIGKGLSCNIKEQYKAHFKCWAPLLPKPSNSLKKLTEQEKINYKNSIKRFTEWYLHSKNLKYK